MSFLILMFLINKNVAKAKIRVEVSSLVPAAAKIMTEHIKNISVP